VPRKMPYNEFVELIAEIEPLLVGLGWSIDTEGYILKDDESIPHFGARFVFPAGSGRSNTQAGIWVYPSRGVDSAEQRGRYRENPDPVKHPGPKGRGWRKRLINYVLSEAKRIGRIEDDDLPFDIEALPVREFARTSDDDLRKFVLGVADCQVFTSAHLNSYDNTIMGMVFMPIAMGAMAVSDEFRALLPDEPEKPGDKPKAPALTLPKEPTDEWVKEPSYPAEPTDKPEPKDVPQDIINSIEWGEIEPDEATAYREGEGVYMERLAKWESTIWNPWKVRCDDLAAKHEADRDKADAEHDAWEAEVSRLEAEHSEAHASIEDDIQAWKQSDNDYRTTKARYDRISQRAFAHHFQNLGVIWEWMAKAGPRSINGYPIFFSCRLMHRDDWTRAEKAILREQTRRESIEL
jgi:hypothetical protein